ncbi:DUF1173 family protein [Azotobacter armeniacus]
MLNRRFSVSLAGKCYSPEFQTSKEYAKGWKSVLEKAYSTTYALCQCPGRGERKLSIKRREKTDELHLARFANTGSEHARECRYYAPAPDRSGMQGYEAKVVEEADDGTLRVRLARGLRVQQATAIDDAIEFQTKIFPGKRKPAMTLLGLLHLLWTEARLNVWYPGMEGERNQGRINFWLLKVASQISASRLKLNEVLLLSAAKDSRDATHNQKVSRLAAERGYRLVTVSPLARYNPERHAGGLSKLPIAGPFGMPTLHMDQMVWTHAENRFGQEISAWRHGARVIAISQFSPRPGGHSIQGEVIELALMQVSERWIPLDSNYEATIEARLHAAGRSYDKPLRFDAEEEEFFPDFWLLDVGSDFPLEVFGMATPEYLERKTRKVAWYNRQYGADGWWSWDAAADPKGLRIPDFPPARQRR